MAFRFFAITLTTFFLSTSVNAALVNFVITGDVIVGDETSPNVFGLSAGDTITATGIFDDSVLVSGSGIIDFSSSSSNTMMISAGSVTFTAQNEEEYFAGAPNIALNNFVLTNFDFVAVSGVNGAVADFDSLSTSFTDTGSMSGEWRTSVGLAPVPLPAAVWLFGSGLIGLIAIARRKRS